jgi:putative ABC transport system permease protein
MDKLIQDLRHGWKSLMSTPRLTLAALACIALGIGSALFMFTLINAVLLQRPPFPDAERLARVRLLNTEGEGQGDISYLEYRDFKEQAKSFDALEVAVRSRMPITTEGGTERVRGESVSPGYFKLIGLRPALGRLFSDDEYAPDAQPVILIGDDLWRRKFGADPEIVNKTLRVRTGQPEEPDRIYTIVGIMPPGFVGTVDPDISEFWLPIEQNPLRQLFEDRGVRNFWNIARLKPGVSIETAKAEAEEIGRRIAAANPGLYDDRQFRIEPFGESWRAPIRAGLIMLMVAAALLLLIACTNIANLLLARLAQREHELTLRLVLGAQRGWILRQLLTESLILSVLGGALGTLLAFWGIKLFVASKSVRLPSYVEIVPDARVVALALGLVLVTGILFGVLPALFGARVNASQQLREASRGVSLGKRQRIYGQVLVVLEVTFTFVLVIGAMLMLRTYLNLTNTDVGFRTQNLLRMAISLDSAEYPDPPARLNFIDRADAAIRNYPGVRDVTIMSEVLPPWDDNSFDMALAGVPNEALQDISRHAIDQNFLRVMEIEHKWGRTFEPNDRQGGPRVALVSESLARFIVGGAEANTVLGKSFQLVRNAETGELSDPYEIVGVVEDVLYHGPRPLMTDLGGNQYDIYVPLAQFPGSVLSLAIHSAGDPAALNLPLQRELGKIAPTSPMHWISTMEEELANQFLDARFYAYLTTGYSICALLLAALGIYGVLANSVTRRFGELGIRMAIGAQGRDIVRLVVGQGMRTLLIGLVIGAVIAILGTKLVVSLLYGVTASDPLTFVMVAAILLVLGLMACYLPARRATRIDPVVVLRND